jgi:hypothetical protein
MSAVQNRRPALELVAQPDTAGDDTEWSINDPAVTTDPAIEQPESWATETVLDQWAPEHQLIGALMWLTADQARPILELVPDTAIWQPIRQWAYVMYCRTLFGNHSRQAPGARLRRWSAVPANPRDRALRSDRPRSEGLLDVGSVIDKEMPR